MFVLLYFFLKICSVFVSVLKGFNQKEKKTNKHTYTMYRETLAQIKNLSYLSPDPQRAERAMLSRLSCNVKLCRKNLTRNMLSTLCKYKYCTRDVEQCIHKLYKGRDHKRINKVISFIMKDKMEDSEKEVRKAKSEYSMATEEYRRAVETRSAADVIFVNIMKTETEKL